jgi:hypothetical protein
MESKSYPEKDKMVPYQGSLQFVPKPVSGSFGNEAIA